MPLRALVLNCTLSPSPAASSTDKLAQEVLGELSEHGVEGGTVRVVDHDVRPGAELDMGDGDEWPSIREQVMAADILVLATPTWVGQHSSVAQRVFERLDAERSGVDDEGRPMTYGKVAVVVVVGNGDGAHHVSAMAHQCLNDVGFTIPAAGVTHWNGAAGRSTDYAGLREPRDQAGTATRSLAANAAHLAGLLRDRPYPPA